jgi:hypothetical protein
MAFLTDLSLAPIVDGLSLIHVVNPSDTTQNPAGSSYQTPLQTIFNLINPVGITGGTYNASTGVITFYTSSGGTFDISGFTTGYTDIQVTGYTYDNNNTFTISETDGTTHSATINQMSGLTVNGDLNVTGTIFSTGSTQFISTTGITISAVTLSTGTTYNGINYAGNVDLTIPSPSGFTGLKIIIKDESGNAGTYRIRLTPSVGTIDGNPYVDMNINYMSLTLVARNNNWWII